MHYLYTVADGLVIYAKATHSRPRPDNPKAKKFGVKAMTKARD